MGLTASWRGYTPMSPTVATRMVVQEPDVRFNTSRPTRRVATEVHGPQL